MQRWGRLGTRQGKRFSCCWFGKPRVGVPREQPRSRWPCLCREKRHESAPVHRIHLFLVKKHVFAVVDPPLPFASCFRGEDFTRLSPGRGCHHLAAPFGCRSLIWYVLLLFRVGERNTETGGLCQWKKILADLRYKLTFAGFESQSA